MRVAHNLRLTSIHKTPEDRESLKTALQGLLNQELSFETEELSETGMETLYTLKLWLDRQPHVRRLLNAILQQLSEDEIKRLESELESRIDERGALWFRLKKSDLTKEKIVLADSGEDVVQVRCNLAAHPSNKENALAIAQRLLRTRQA